MNNLTPHLNATMQRLQTQVNPNLKTVRGVTKGDRFDYKNGTYEVTSVCRVIDIETGEVIDYKCYARGIDTLAKNVFEIPFSTVTMNKI